MSDSTVTLRSAGERPGLVGRGRTPEARTFLLALAVLAVLTLAMFGDVLFAGNAVLGREGEDIVNFFIPRRQFGFDELKQGNLALWNPYIFSGLPCFGAFQSALLYPLHFLYLLLPLAEAINWTIAMHVFLGGVFMYLWAWHRGLSPVARLLAAVLFMFCGAHFMNIASGHLANLTALVWSPLVLLAVDGLLRSRSYYSAKQCFAAKHELGWCLLGAFAVAMQILAGHPQYVFFTGVAAGLYTALCLVRSYYSAKQCFAAKHEPGRWRVAAGFVGIYLAGAALAAVQLLTGLDAAGEGVRGGGAPYWFAATFSLPPENLITLAVPGFFGDTIHAGYWGRWNHFEMTPFVGVTAVVLAVYGALLARREVRRFSAAMVAVFLILALGKYTPLHRFLHNYVPPFSSFRTMSRCAFQASLFIIMLAAAGLDELLRRGRACRRTALAVAVLAVAAAAAALAVRQSATTGMAGWWHDVMHQVYLTEETTEVARTPHHNIYEDAEFVRGAGLFASNALFVAAGTGLLLAGLLLARISSRRWALGVALLAAVEVFVFARTMRPTIEYPGQVLRIEDIVPSLRHVEEYVAGHEGDYRILSPVPNSAMNTRMESIWGIDSFVLKRYTEFMAFTQEMSPDQAAEQLLFSQLGPLHRMLRLRYIFAPADDGVSTRELPDPLGRLELIRDYRIIRERNRIFEAMAAEGFDPRRTVILETPPDPSPEAFGRGGQARVVDSSTDHLTIEADLPGPAILLITDTYAAGWRAVALPGSVQDSYRLMPANYILRAVPLAAGKHRLRVEYAPPAFTAGAWISGVSAAAYLALLGWYVLRRMRKGRDRPVGHGE